MILSDVIPSPVDDPEIDFEQLKNAVSSIKKKSHKAAMEIVYNRLVADEYVTLQQLGDQMGNITRERARQIKNKAIDTPAFKRIRQDLLTALEPIFLKV